MAERNCLGTIDVAISRVKGFDITGGIHSLTAEPKGTVVGRGKLGSGEGSVAEEGLPGSGNGRSHLNVIANNTLSIIRTPPGQCVAVLGRVPVETVHGRLRRSHIQVKQRGC